MTPNNLIDQLDQMIEGLEYKKGVLDAILRRFKEFRASLNGMPPELVALLKLPEEMQGETVNLGMQPSVANSGTQARTHSSPSNVTATPGPFERELNDAIEAGEPADEEGTDDQEDLKDEGDESSQSAIEAARDKLGWTITDWAVAILSERPGVPMHFRSIANKAIEQGYQSPRSKLKKTIYRSFWAMMNRNPQLFVPKGGGYYLLRGKEADRN
jgi:hypothetical protein